MLPPVRVVAEARSFMALVRCPSCGRVADGKSCFACGYEWPVGGAAAPAPAPEPHKPSQSQSFKIASPSSFPTAKVVPPAAPEEEVNLDVEIDAEPPPPPPAFSSTPAPAPAFPSTPAPAPAFSGFGQPAPAFGQPPPAFGQPPPAFGQPPPAFAGFPPPAFPSPSGNWGAPPQQQVTSTSPSLPSGLPSGLGAPPPAFPSPSGSWGSPPAPAPTPAFPSPSGNWGPPPAAFPAIPPLPRLDTVPPPSAPAAPQYQTPAAPQPPPRASKPPAALNGLFDGLSDAPSAPPAAHVDISDIGDGLDIGVTEERSAVPATLEELPPVDDVGGGMSVSDNVVRDSAQDAGDFFNFTLEPGATVEPGGAEPSPFGDDGDGGAAVHRAPTGSGMAGLDVSFELPADLPDVPPPVATAPPAGSTPGFAEVDFEMGGLDAGLDGQLAPSAGGANAGRDAGHDVGFDNLDAGLDAGLDADLDAVTGTVEPTPESTGDPLAGLSLDDLPADLPADEPGGGGMDVSLESNVDLGGVDDIVLGGDLAEPPPAPPAEDDFSLAGLEAMDAPPRTPPPPPPAASSGPTLSTRVGKLAETLEDAGRIADAALLYEVQAVLSATGR